MLIPKYNRKRLRSIGHHRWFWYRIADWAFGKRYKFRDGSIVYLSLDDEILTIRKGGYVIWKG